MKSDVIKTLTNNFEANSYTTEEGIEFWRARDLPYVLKYLKWDNFQSVISKTKTVFIPREKIFQAILPTSGK